MSKKSRKDHQKELSKNLICSKVYASIMVGQNIIRALRAVYGKLRDEKVRWVLIGTTSLALQGLDTVVEDIDILTDRAGAFRIGELLREYEVRPVEFGRSGIFESYFGVFEIEGVSVEVMGELKERVGDRWLSAIQKLDCPTRVEIEGMSIPVSSLREQLMAYERLGRKGDLASIKKIKEALGRRRRGRDHKELGR